jgi:hypothetical protein
MIVILGDSRQSPGLMNLQQLTLRGSLNVLRQLLREPTVKQRFRVTVGEGKDHGENINAARSDRNACTDRADPTAPAAYAAS